MVSCVLKTFVCQVMYEALWSLQHVTGYVQIFHICWIAPDFGLFASRRSLHLTGISEMQLSLYDYGNTDEDRACIKTKDWDILANSFVTCLDQLNVGEIIDIVDRRNNPRNLNLRCKSLNRINFEGWIRISIYST